MEGLDRAQMERERLERLAAKKRNQSDPESETSRIVAPVTLERDSAKRFRVVETKKTTLPPYHRGEFFMTALDNIGSTQPGCLPRIPLQKILGNNAKRACLTSMLVDYEWLRALLGSKLPLHLVVHSRESTGTFVHDYDRNTTMIYPAIPDQYGSMHAKLMLIWFDNFLRVAISSANLIPSDWAWTENITYVQDFLEKSDNSSSPSAEQNDFASYLKAFSVSLGLPDSILRCFDEFNFSTAKVHLVASVPGQYSESNLHQYGLKRFQRVVTDKIGAENGSFLYDIAIQSSSLGALHLGFVHSLAHCVTGRTPQYGTRNKSTVQKSGSKKEANDADDGKDQSHHKVKIVYPSRKTGRGFSHPEVADCLCLSRNSWSNPRFPKYLLHDCIDAHNPGMVMHTKIISVTVQVSNKAQKSEGSGSKPSRWIYIGSANFSESAWGSLSKPKNGKEVMKIRSFELGLVVFQDEVVHSMDALIPYRVPLRKYDDNEEPFFYGEAMTQVETLAALQTTLAAFVVPPRATKAAASKDVIVLDDD